MASSLRRTLASRGRSDFHRGVFSEAAAASSGGEGMAVRRRGVSLAPSIPIRRLQYSGAQVEPPKSLDEKVKLLYQTIKDVNRKMEKGHVVYASINRLAAEKKPHNPYVQWLWHMCAITGILYYQNRTGSATKDN